MSSRAAKPARPAAARGAVSGFTLIETLAVVALVGALAGAVGWTAQRIGRDARVAEARATLAGLDATARRTAGLVAVAGPLTALVRGEPVPPPRPADAAGAAVVVRFDLREQRVSLAVAGEPGPRASLPLPPGLELREVWRAGADTNPQRSAVVAVPYAAGGGAATHALELREAGASRWTLVAGHTGQRTRLDTRARTKEVFDALARADAD